MDNKSAAIALSALTRVADALTKLAASQATNTELLQRLLIKMEPLMDKALIAAARDVQE